MNAQEIIAKADTGEGLTEEEVRLYQKAVKPQKQVYGKYGTLALKYLEENNVGKYWAIENLPEYLHGIDRQADELYETMYAKLSLLKAVVLGFVVAGTFIMNCIGAIICAITE